MEARNIAGWNLISDRYQRERGWPKDDLFWGHRVPPESELRLLGDLRGKRVLVLGCGGGQDLVALARLGAVGIVGVDFSPAQLEVARRLIADEKVDALLHEHNIEALPMFSTQHPLDCATSEEAPYNFQKSYFEVEVDEPWRSLGGEAAPFRRYHRTVADWFECVQSAGFHVDRLLEPRPSQHVVWPGAEYHAKLEMIPGTLILRAHKP